MSQQGVTDDVQILHFEDRHHDDFERLNLAWIEKDFFVEPPDDRQFAAPRAEIIEPGGAILIAERAGIVVGTVALMKHGEDQYELCKMTVVEAERGNGIGIALMEALIAEARERGASTITLHSHTKLVPAIRLYEKFGFRQIPLDPKVRYEQANVTMSLCL